MLANQGRNTPFRTRFPASGIVAMGALLLTVSLGYSAPKRNTKSPTAANPSASTQTSATAPLDTAQVRKYYMDGDFDPAIDILETSLRYKKNLDHEDSVFAFKHLGVMYAAKYETREKGKHYMLQLLNVEPTARILDMYASDMIYMIFKNIQDEFEAARTRLDRADSMLVKNNRPAPHPEPEPKEKPKQGGSSTYVWAGATGAALVMAGVATYWAFSDEPKTKLVDHTLPENAK